MKRCKLAQPAIGECAGGYSKWIRCEADGVERCLKECMAKCPLGKYQPVDEPVPPTRTGGRRQTAMSSGTAVQGKPCGGGGGCGENTPKGYTNSGQNISYGNAGQNISYS
jgi:hypothetical protein